MYKSLSLQLLLNGSGTQGILAAEFLNARLGKERFGLSSATNILVLFVSEPEPWSDENILASMLISQSINLGRARAHDIIRRRNILIGPKHSISQPAAGCAASRTESSTRRGGRKKNVRLSRHLGLEHLAMVFHALNVLDSVLLLHGGVDILVSEDLGHCSSSLC